MVPVAVETAGAGYSPLPPTIFTAVRSSQLQSTASTTVAYYDVIEPAAATAKDAAAAIYFFARRVATIPDVLAVTYSMDADVHLVWTFIRQRDKAIRRAVYEQELQLMDTFPTFIFDFNVVAIDPTQGRPLLPDDLQGRIVLYRE